MIRLLILLTFSLLVACTSAPAAPAPTHDTAPTAAPQPTRTKVIGALGGVVAAGWAPDFGGIAGTSRGCMRSIGAGRYALELDLEEGDRMLSAVISAAGNFGASLEVWRVSAYPTASAPPATVVLTVPNVPSEPIDLPVDLVDTVITGGVSYWFEFGASEAGLCVGAVRLTYDRPTP